MLTAAKIKCIIFDVDGVFTDGRLYYSEQGETIKAFHVHDGLGVKLLQQHGIIVAIISGRESAIVTQRMTELGIKYIYQGHSEKLTAFEHLLALLKYDPLHFAYMGDDLPDLPVMQKVGFSITVPNANAIIREHADWQTQALGGNGAVREACEFLLTAQQKSFFKL